VSLRGRGLAGKPSLGDEFELFAVSRDELLRKDRPIRYRLRRSPDVVTAIEIVERDDDRAETKTVTASRMSGDEKLPSDLLADGHLDAARVAYLALYAENPEDPGIAEPRLNGLGYHLAGERDFAKAIAILRINNELRPQSANTYDSLAEVYLMNGERDRALETYRRELEALPNDTTTEAGLRERLRSVAEQKIKELERAPDRP